MTDSEYMEDIDYIGAGELVFNNDPKEGIYSGGFSVKSIMMKNGMSPIMTLNSDQNGGGSGQVSDLFNNLVIPNWALSYRGGFHYKDKEDQYVEEDEDDEDAEDDYVDDDLHDKLLELVKEHKPENYHKKMNKRRETRKYTNSKKGGTKRRK
jgi:hypothetical protein